MHIKKTLYIIVLSLCFVLALIGKSYGQDLKIVDEDSVIVLNSIKQGDFLYSVESKQIGWVYSNNYMLHNIDFTKRDINGRLLNKCTIGKFFQSWLYYTLNPGCVGCSRYEFYKIQYNINTDQFIVSFADDSILSNQRSIYYKVCAVSRVSFANTILFKDSVGFNTSNWFSFPTIYQYDNMSIVLMNNNKLLFPHYTLNITDTTYNTNIIELDLQGNVNSIDNVYKSKYYPYTNFFNKDDTILAFIKFKDSILIRKYDSNLQELGLILKKTPFITTSNYDLTFFDNNDIQYLYKIGDSSLLYSVIKDSISGKIGLIYVYPSRGYSNLDKPLTENNHILSYSVNGLSASNKIQFYSTAPLKQKFTHDVIPYHIRFSYRGIPREATAYITAHASELNDSCIYVFGNISFYENNRNKSLLFVKKVCNSQSDYNLDNFVIEGNVFADFNDNCIEDSQDKKIKNLTITDDYKGMLNFTSPDTNGNYKFSYSAYDTGIHTIKIRGNINYPYYIHDSCSQEIILVPYDADTISNINLSLKPSFLCPINTVNVSSSPPFRIGQPQTYYVNYCNNGTILSPNTYVTIKLDSLLDINSSSIPYSTLPNHTYRFNIGNLDYLTCGSFSFVATPRIGAVQLNQTLCVEAHIYPDSVCTSPNYTGSFIVASAQCLGDSVELKLENRGGDMLVRKRYKVIEDQVMRINNEYQLPRNGTLIEKMPADSGHTYRIIAEQEDDLPASYGDKFATAAIEGCRPNPNDNFSTGFFAPFPDYDGEPFRDLSCNVITGAYDPNDKVASPLGYAAQHYIEKNTQIDYQINFQNTGNDTAFKVVLVDTISPNLDINSIQLGVASHAYQFQRTDSNVVQFVFDNILLVDSFRNEPKSHGFVKFKIQQKLNNPNGTKIYNKADIYFDYNAPIVTNQTYHTVGQNFITAQLISSVKNPKFNVKEVKVFPNPFREKTQIIVEAELLKNPVLLLMNVEGKIIKTILSSNNNTFDIYREDLTNGMYLFKIMQGNDEVANGKVMLQ